MNGFARATQVAGKSGTPFFSPTFFTTQGIQGGQMPLLAKDSTEALATHQSLYLDQKKILVNLATLNSNARVIALPLITHIYAIS